MTLRLRIATFNLESLDDRPDLEPSLAERIAVLRPRLLRLDADVLCLQEVNGQRPETGGGRALLALDRLLAETPYAGYHRVTAGASGLQAISDVHNLVILSRFPIPVARALRHDLVPPPSLRPVTARPPAVEAEPIEWDRPILLAEVALPGGRRLHVVNLHLRAPLAAPVVGQKLDAFAWRSLSGWAEGFFIATVKRTGQALETRLLVEEIFDRDPRALVAVLGDFNAEERETPLRTIRGDTEDSGNPRLADRALVPLEQSLPETQRYSVLYYGRKAMLDHLLVSPALFAHYRHVEVLNEALAAEPAADAAIARGRESSHAPVVAEFALPDPAE